MATLRLTVTELKCAASDPAWRARWLRGEPSRPLDSIPSNNNGGLPVMGSEFHQLAEEFTLWLTTPENLEEAARLAEGGELWHALFDHVAGVRLAQWLRGTRGGAVTRLADCLRAFCNRLAELRARHAGFQTWRDLFLVQEFAMGEIEIPVGSHLLIVSGRVDAVRLRPGEGIEIVDYKLSSGEAGKADFIQLSIYAHLMGRRDPGLACRGVLEYYTPELQEVLVEPGALLDVYRQVVEPVLPELFPKSPARSLGVPPSGGISETPARVAPAPAASAISALPSPPADQDPSARIIQQAFADFGLDVEIAGQIEAPQLRRILVQPAVGVKVVSLANRAEDLQVKLSLDLPPLIRPVRGAVAIDIPKAAPDKVLWSRVIADPALHAPTSPVRFPVGLAVDNHLIVADLADSRTCHALIGGASGSGKSEFLKSLVAALMHFGDPATLRLSLIDPKLLTFSALEGSPYLAGGVISSIGPAIQCLEAAVTDMEARYQRMSVEGVQNLAERFTAGRRDIPYHVIVFDEFADLVLAGKDERKTFETLVTRLAQKGRAAGIHVILATQRPDRTIVSGLIKSNLPLKVCLKVTTEANSRIILDESGGQALFGKGDLLCDLGRGLERAQSPIISQEELLRVARVKIG